VNQGGYELSMDRKLSMKEAMQALKVSERTIYRLMEAGRLSGEKVDGEWRFDQSAVRSCKVKHKIRHRNKPLTSRHVVAPRGYITVRQLLQELPLISTKQSIIKDIKAGLLPAFRYQGIRTPYFIRRRDANAYKARYALRKVEIA
jgi:excisionase family DNA binding protein